MFRFRNFIALLALSGFCASWSPSQWGFFAHRRINRQAVFSLPPEMIVFYKRHVEYLTTHAVDPDKRRYATRHEAPRHYIDLDRWGTYPFPQVPRDWPTALLRYTDLLVISGAGDTLHLLEPASFQLEEGRLQFSEAVHPMVLYDGVGEEAYRRFFIRQVLPQYYEERWTVSCDSLWRLLNGDSIPCREVWLRDRFSEHGILPYHLLRMQERLTEAFRQGDPERILRLSADMGHYIGDAHVPLHTTENYNGQLTGQEGIHAFWESRIPELFVDAEYDFFVGKAQYIQSPRDYFWNIVLSSHRLVDEVLQVEKELSRTFPPDQQYCFEERLGATVRTQCRAYAEAYRQRLAGQVERRMRAAILAVSSSWYTAWADAGQPDLGRLLEVEVTDAPSPPRRGLIQGRRHE